MMESFVLIVDDDIDAREIFGGIVSSTGVRTEFASDGDEALSIIRNTLPSLILLDLMMPGMDGFTVLSRLNGNPSTRRIPVIVVTAYGGNLTEMMMLPGVKQVVHKGQFMLSEVQEAVSTVLNKSL